MKKVLKILGVLVVILFAVFATIFLVLDEPVPDGEKGAAADAMAERMMTALNYDAWKATETVSWTFGGVHHYEWDKADDVVTVRWDDNEVVINTAMQSGIVTNGQNYSFEEADALTQQAIDFFNNDSFWLAAPFKAFDPGTERSIVTLADDQEALMVRYNSGGSTPGDTYVWILDEKNRPAAIKMWVQILPIGGLEFSWENYVTLPSGAMIAKNHIGLGGFNVELKDIQ